MIKLGTNTMNIQGIEKAYLGSNLVYEKANYAPVSTTGLFHLDTGLTNEVSGGTSAGGTYNQTQGKFNKAHNINDSSHYIEFPIALGTQGYHTDSWTFEFWCQFNFTNHNPYLSLRALTSSNTGLSNFIYGQLSSQGLLLDSNYRQSTILNEKPVITDQNFHHFAFTFYSGHLYIFLDGQKISDYETKAYTNYDIVKIKISSTGSNYPIVIDEILVDHEAKYISNFTPPTRPYTLRP